MALGLARRAAIGPVPDPAGAAYIARGIGTGGQHLAAGEEYAEQLQYVAAGRAKSRSLRPLRQILPFLKPYRWRIAIALVALIISSAATLVLPVAGRGLIDHGFNAAEVALISHYFLVVAAVLLVMIPLILFGRWVRTLSRKSQDRLADTSAHASETLNAVQTVQAFTHETLERRAYAKAVESSFDVAILRTRARAVMSGCLLYTSD